ncbi:uncharacterized protein [Primulina huaijiensis]|uniref:uncharacterized protein n=1 Tax=Primulina huaijiensis TaxID=1492673 RepID=UPI003CC752CE
MTKYGTKSGMASTSESTTPSPTPQIMSDASPLSITCHKLNGKNFLPWSQSVFMYICGRGKEEFLTGSASQPEFTDPNYKKWKAENNQVMAWLINSMIPEIGENFLLYPSASEIWDAARESYSCSDNTAELFAIESAVHDLRQEDSTVTEYFSTLTRNWQTIDLTETHDWKCSKDEKLFRSFIENKRVFKFLMGLNNNFDDVRGRILSTNPLPNLRAAFSVVRQEESRRKVMLGSSPQSSDNSALVVQRQNNPSTTDVTAHQGFRQGQPPNNTKGKMIPGRPWCEFCKKPTHNIDSCWKIHGKPLDWKPARERRAHSAVSEQPPSTAAPFTRTIGCSPEVILPAYDAIFCHRNG